MGIFANGNTAGNSAAAGGVGSGTTFNLKAGEPVALRNLITIGPDGLAWNAKTSDYAAVSAAKSSIIASSNLGVGYAQSYDRPNVTQAANGDIYVAKSVSSSQGVTVSRFSSLGALLGSVTVDSSDTITEIHMSFLSNGNIAVSYSDNINLRFAIYTPALSLVAGVVTVDASEASYKNHAVTALSGGGFALIWQNKAPNTNVNMAIFDNAGAVVLAKTNIKTVTGAYMILRLAQLSNGNIVVLIIDSAKAVMGIFTAAGVAVVAPADIDTGLNVSGEISVMPGFFAVAFTDSSSKIGVRTYNNAGVSQSAKVSLDCIGQVMNCFRIINDGAAFWIGYTKAQSKQVLTKIAVNGVNKTFDISLGYSGNRSLYTNYDMFYECNRVVILSCGPADQENDSSCSVFNTVSEVLESFYGRAELGVLSNVSGRYNKMIPGGDFSAIVLANGNNNSTVWLFAFKYASASIVGVAAGGSAAGSLVPVAALSGTYAMNQLKGSPTKSFDHSAGSVVGNKGTLLTYGAVLKGY